jgi:hypothetical protein
MSENNREDSPRPIEPIEQPPPAEQLGSAEPFRQPGQSEDSIPPELTNTIRTFFIAVSGWVVPGSAHLFQGRFGRALVAFLAVGAMACVGMKMRGTVFPPHGDDVFGVLGFLADAGSGMFYFFAHTFEKAGPDVSRAAGDYGTRLVATAGVLNLLFVLDAMEISRRQKI